MSKFELNCTICDTTLTGKYCHICGQYNTGRKITFRELIGDFIAGIFSFERSVLATMWLLIRRPATIVHNYWAGWRGYYHSPGKITVYAAFIVGLHFLFIGNEFLGLNVKFTNIPPQIGLIIVLIPLYSLSSKITFFKRKHTYLEHLISMIYLFSTWIIIFILLDLIQRFLLGNIFDEAMFASYIIVMFFWSAWVYASDSKWYILLVYTLIQIIILLLIVAVIIGSIYLFLPDAIEVVGNTQ